MKIVKERTYIGDMYPCTCESCGASAEICAHEFAWAGTLWTVSWRCPECKHRNFEYVPKLMRRKVAKYDVVY